LIIEEYIVYFNSFEIAEHSMGISKCQNQYILKQIVFVLNRNLAVLLLMYIILQTASLYSTKYC